MFSKKVWALTLGVLATLVLAASAFALSTSSTTSARSSGALGCGVGISRCDVTNDSRFSGATGNSSCTQISGATLVAHFAKNSQEVFPETNPINGVTLSNITTGGFDFTSTTAIAYVLIHAGHSLTLYDYTPTGTTSGTGLTAISGGLSGVWFCTASGLLAVNLRSVTATPSAKGVTVRWRTASEIDVAGYNVYGLVHGKRVKLNSHIIASKGSGANSYSFSYRTPQGKRAPAAFWLQAINLDGTRTMRAARIVH